MAHIFWNEGDRVDKKAAVDALMRELPKFTDTQFTAKVESDDAGSHLVAYIERNIDDTIPDKHDLPGKFLGWRLLVIHVHEGFIKYVMNGKRYDE
tara:strand:+ start:112 stop:396 length:285 start_codon:yes stop_codon:yes gene_type:complete